MGGSFVLNGGPFDGHVVMGTPKGVLYFVSLNTDTIKEELPGWVPKKKLQGIPIIWSIDKDPDQVAYRYEYEGEHQNGHCVLQYKSQVLSREVHEMRMSGEY